MNDVAVRSGWAEPEVDLRADLARGDAVIGSITPILRHLLASDDHSLFGDEIIARVRGIVADLARQLAEEIAVSDPSAERGEPPAAVIDALVRDLVDVPGLLTHAHALALEWQLTERLQARLGVDPVLTPLLQALISSPDVSTSAIAMKLLAAQARFAQAMRRMQLPLFELPGDLLHGALQVMRCHSQEDAAANERGAAAEAAVRARYDESRSRLGLIARLVTGMGGGAVAALSVSHAGVALFMTALALASGQVRELTILSTNEGQATRLALSLRAAGLRVENAAEQFLAINPEACLPPGVERIGPDEAAAILAPGPGHPGG